MLPFRRGGSRQGARHRVCRSPQSAPLLLLVRPGLIPEACAQPTPQRRSTPMMAYLASKLRVGAFRPLDRRDHVGKFTVGPWVYRRAHRSSTDDLVPSPPPIRKGHVRRCSRPTWKLSGSHPQCSLHSTSDGISMSTIWFCSLSMSPLTLFENGSYRRRERRVRARDITSESLHLAQQGGRQLLQVERVLDDLDSAVADEVVAGGLVALGIDQVPGRKP